MNLSDNEYNKIKLIYKLSHLMFFIKHCAVPDAQKENDKKLETTLTEAEKQLDTLIRQVYTLLCTKE